MLENSSTTKPCPISRTLNLEQSEFALFIEHITDDIIFVTNVGENLWHQNVLKIAATVETTQTCDNRTVFEFGGEILERPL